METVKNIWAKIVAGHDWVWAKICAYPRWLGVGVYAVIVAGLLI